MTLAALSISPQPQPQPISYIPPPPPSGVRLRSRGDEDAALVTAALNGDMWSFRAIWSKYVGLVRSKLAHVRQDSDDCVQEVLIRLHSRLPYLRDRTALGSFIIGITLRVAGTAARRRRTGSWILLTPTGNLPEPHYVIDDQGASSREALTRFKAVLAKLGPNGRRAFELRYVEHKELVDVAREMNVSLATAKRHLARVVACVNVMSQRDPVLAHYLEGHRLKTTTKKARARHNPSGPCRCFECTVGEPAEVQAATG